LDVRGDLAHGVCRGERVTWARSMKSRRGLSMRDHLSNAFYGVIDYVAWPAGMLVVAPAAVRTLGVDRYGILVVAGSVISTGAIVA